MPGRRASYKQIRLMLGLTAQDEAYCRQQLDLARARSDTAAALHYAQLYAQCVYLQRQLLERLRERRRNRLARTVAPPENSGGLSSH